MKKIVFLLLSLITCCTFFIGATACGGNSSAGGPSSGEQTGVQNKLETPSVLLVGNKAEWKKVPNASSYRYKIGEDGEEVVTIDLVKTLADGQTIYVKAVGDRDFYLDSDWSQGVTYTKNSVQLERPVCTYENFVVTWSPVENAIAYEYKFTEWTDNNTTIYSTTELMTIPHTEGYFCVRAVGDGEYYTTSNWRQVKAPEKLMVEQGSVHLNGKTGEVNWEASYYAIRYDYKIDNGEVINGGRGGKVTLTDGQTIYFKAIGDGVNYLDSDWFSLTYTASGGGGDNGYV